MICGQTKRPWHRDMVRVTQTHICHRYRGRKPARKKSKYEELMENWVSRGPTVCLFQVETGAADISDAQAALRTFQWAEITRRERTTDANTKLDFDLSYQTVDGSCRQIHASCGTKRKGPLWKPISEEWRFGHNYRPSSRTMFWPRTETSGDGWIPPDDVREAL